MSRRRFQAGDRVRVNWVAWAETPRAYQDGTWQVTHDEVGEGAAATVWLRRTDRRAGGLQISARRVDLVATAEEELARELMGR